MEKVRKILTIENLLYAFIVLCPILDIISFVFRNTLQTSFSPATFLRPILPVAGCMYLFVTHKELRKKMIGVGAIYAIYAGIHLWLMTKVITGASYSGVTHELQYLINYTFMIVTLFVYFSFFYHKDKKKLKKAIVIAAAIYIGSIFLSIVTGTSSTTYIEGMGKKGWFESGNSISAILILSLFVLLPMIKEKKYRYGIVTIVFMIGVFLTMFIGTRVGLLGFILVLLLYGAIEIFVAILHKIQLNKYVIIGSLAGIAIIILVVGIMGSSTLERRKHLQEIESDIVDTSIETASHISGDLLKIKQQIDENTLPNGYLSEPAKRAMIDLYDYANAHNVVNNDMRTQQLIYNVYLVKEQADPLLILFGNGYMANFRELVLEMEIPAFLFNFGIVGFTLYFVPFLAVFLYGGYIAIRNIKKMDAEYLLLLAGIFFSFAFGFLSGYTFFNISTMLMIVLLVTLLVEKIKKIKLQE